MKFLTIFLVLAVSAIASPAPPVEAMELESRFVDKRVVGPAPSTGEICPQASGLYYRGKSGADFQIACDYDVSGGFLLAVYPNIANVIACAAQCDLWNNQVPSNKCTASTWYRYPPDGVNNCFSRNAAWTAYTGNVTALNGISSFPS